MTDMHIRIEWHSPDACYVATFMRDGEPWYLDGALIGMDWTPGLAVTELCKMAEHLVIEGENFLTEEPLSMVDRVWLFGMLDPGSTREQEMYDALRAAGGRP